MTNQPLETEIKLVASPAMLQALRDHPALAVSDAGSAQSAAEVSETIITTYFDTADGLLGRNQMGLRLRWQGGICEQTLKIAGKAGSAARRTEWTVPVTAQQPDPARFPEAASAQLAGILGDAAIEAVALTRVERTIRTLRHGESHIEVAFDVGTVETGAVETGADGPDAGGRSEPLCELELELLDGRLSDMAALALLLSLGPELYWSVESKAERCLALARDLPPRAVHAAKLALRPEMGASAGFRAIGWNCLDHLLANYPLVIRTGDAEALHQSRVAIRRLRAAFSLFAGQVDDAESRLLRAEFRAAAQALGPARDLFVLLERLEKGRDDADGQAGGEENAEESAGAAGEMAALLALIRARFDAATRAAQDMLASGQFQQMLFRFVIWLESGAWQSPPAGDKDDMPLPALAAHILASRRRKMRDLDKRLADMSDAARHRLRIRAKKLRYAAGFFASLFPDRQDRKHQQAFAAALGRLQDSLGDLNDLAVAGAGHWDLFGDLDPVRAARLAARLESVLASHGASRHRLLKTARQALVEIGDMDAWWKNPAQN